MVFQKGPGLKTSTAAVRTSYIECMSACFHGNTLAQGTELIPLLLKTIEKAVSQPVQVGHSVFNLHFELKYMK